MVIEISLLNLENPNFVFGEFGAAAACDLCICREGDDNDDDDDDDGDDTKKLAPAA